MTFEQFAEYLGLTLECVSMPQRNDGMGETFAKGSNHYDLRVMRGNKLIVATQYSQGSGITTEPQIEDVLLSLFYDTCDLHGTEVDNLSDFAEWVDHVGHNDLKRAVKMYELCHETFDTMKDTLTHDEREAFFDCTEDEQEPTEGEISERFDSEVMPFIIEQYGVDDVTAINESFNNWTDSLCKDGEISKLLYNRIEYVGKYSKGES